MEECVINCGGPSNTDTPSPISHIQHTPSPPSRAFLSSPASVRVETTPGPRLPTHAPPPRPVSIITPVKHTTTTTTTTTTAPPPPLPPALARTGSLRLSSIKPSFPRDEYFNIYFLGVISTFIFYIGGLFSYK